MKTLGKRSIIFALIFLTVVVLGFFTVNYITVPTKASSSEVEGFFDDFNSSGISAEWKNNGATPYAPYNAMRFNGGYYWAGGAVINQKIFDKKDVTVSVDLKAESLGSWFGLGFGGQDTTSNFFSYDGAIIFSIGDVRLFEKVGASGILDSEKINATTVFSDAISNVLRITYGFGYDISTEKYTITLNVYKTPVSGYDYQTRTADFGESIFTCEYTNVSINLQYLCFNSMHHVLDILKVQVTDAQGEIFFDDFSTPSMTYPSDVIDGEKWHVNNSYNERTLYIAPIGSVNFADGDFMVYTENVFRVVDYIDKIFTITLDVTLQNQSVGSGVVIGFGLNTQSSSIDGINAVGVRKNSTGEYDLCLYRKGSVIEKGSSVSLEDGKVYKLSISVYSDNRVQININGKTSEFQTLDYNGQVGIGSIGNGNQFSIDNFDYRYYVYKYSDAQDASINFKGTKENEDGTISYYINEKEWFFGSNVGFPLRYNANRNRIVFANCNGYSSFGPKAKYAEYMMQFNVKLTGGEKLGSAFGLAFAKSSYSSNILLTTAVGFMYNDAEKIHKTDTEKTVQTTLQGINVLNNNGATYSYIRDDGAPVNMWDGRTYNVCFIVKNRTVKVFFKEENQPIEKLAICRAEYVNVDTYGYPSVFGHNGVSFELMDFKITNLGLS